MSFQAPLFLAGLAVVPLALAALILARRRPAKYVIRFPAAATLAPLVKRGSRVRRNLPPALLMLALAATGDRARAAGGDRRRAGREGLGHARHRHLGLDERDRRLAEPARPPPRPPPTASSRRSRSSCRSASSRTPTGRTRCCARPRTALQVAVDARRAAGRRRHRHRRRAGQRADRRWATRSRRRSCCCPTARARPARDPAEVAAEGPRRERADLHRRARHRRRRRRGGRAGAVRAA